MSFTQRFDKTVGCLWRLKILEKVILLVVSEKEAGSVVEPGSRPVPVILH